MAKDTVFITAEFLWAMYPRVSAANKAYTEAARLTVIKYVVLWKGLLLCWLLHLPDGIATEYLPQHGCGVASGTEVEAQFDINGFIR